MKTELVLLLAFVSSVIDSAPATNSRNCNSHQFWCNDTCIHESIKCDGIDDCGDNSDEEGCGGDGQSVSPSGAEGIFFLVISISCAVGVACCCVLHMKARSRAHNHTPVVATTPPAAGTTVVTTAQTTSAAAPATQPVQQQYYPAEFKTGPQEAPPPYPGDGYATYSPRAPQDSPQQAQTSDGGQEAPPSYPGCATSTL